MQHNVRPLFGGLSPVAISAVFSVIALVVVIGISLEQTVVKKNTDLTAATSAADINNAQNGQGDSSDLSDLNGFGALGNGSKSSAAQDVASIGPNVVGQMTAHYMAMQQGGTYTPESAAQVANDMAPNVKATVPHKMYTTSDIKTTPDTSYQRMLDYRGDMRTALAPLLKNSTPEISLYGLYAQTKSVEYLTKLQTIIKNYSDAADASVHVIVPQDALLNHIAALNAMQEFGSTLDSMVSNVDDPVTSVALLRS